MGLISEAWPILTLPARLVLWMYLRWLAYSLNTLLGLFDRPHSSPE